MSLKTTASTLLKRSLLLRPTTPPSRSFASCNCSLSPTSSPSTTPSTTTTTTQPRRPDLNSSNLRYLQSLDPKNLAVFDPTLDLHPSKKFSPPLSPSQRHPATVVLLNDEPSNRGYSQPRPPADLIDGLPGDDDSTAHLASLTHLSPGEIRNLYRFPLIVKRVVTMKSKGKMPSMYSLVVVGNGNGLVGVGEGKDDTANKAVSKAFNQAVRSMDYVQRYEDRTVWGTMESNFGSCKIQMRSRPPGALPAIELRRTTAKGTFL